jgi:hypothetical protein
MSSAPSLATLRRTETQRHSARRRRRGGMLRKGGLGMGDPTTFLTGVARFQAAGGEGAYLVCHQRPRLEKRTKGGDSKDRTPRRS